MFDFVVVMNYEFEITNYDKLVTVLMLMSVRAKREQVMHLDFARCDIANVLFDYQY